MIHTGKTGRTRLTGDDLTALRTEVFERDNWRCQTCGRPVDDDLPDWHPRKAHMAHKEGRGRGGSDTATNNQTKCHECHFRFEHSPKTVMVKT